MTNNQRATLRMSLIPLVIIIGLILGAGYFLLQGEIKLPQFNKGPQIRRLDGFPTAIVTDKVMQKQRLVVKSQAELATFLNSIDPTGMTTVRSPVDFNKEYILAVSSDTQTESGHKIQIKKIYEDKANKTLSISIEETEAGANCKVDKESNITADAVAISKTDYEINFDRVKKVADCSSDNSNQSSDSTQPQPTK